MESLLACSPALCGFLLLITAHIDLYLFKQGLISVRQAIGHEALFFVCGFGAVFLVFFLSVQWLLAKRWKLVGLGIVSTLVFVVCLTIVSANGAAIFNAT